MSNTEELTFSLTEDQLKKYQNWVEEKGPIYAGAIGGAYSVCFTQTSLGDFVEVRCIDGTVLHLTDYDDL